LEERLGDVGDLLTDAVIEYFEIVPRPGRPRSRIEPTTDPRSRRARNAGCGW
jgi:hypothetical protein